MTDWRKQLSNAKQDVVNREKKQARERRDAERAERMKAENRMAAARRKVNEPPPTQVRPREPVNLLAARMTQKASEWAKPPPPTQSDIRREALLTQKREHENALVVIKNILRNTL